MLSVLSGICVRRLQAWSQVRDNWHAGMCRRSRYAEENRAINDGWGQAATRTLESTGRPDACGYEKGQRHCQKDLN
jgi:hypothetical protein